MDNNNSDNKSSTSSQKVSNSRKKVDKKVLDKPTIFVVMRTKEGITFKDKVKAITSYNEKGPFDVLPEHENFISLINQHLVIHTMDGKENEIKVDTAVIKVYKNEVHIFLGLSGAR